MISPVLQPLRPVPPLLTGCVSPSKVPIRNALLVKPVSKVPIRDTLLVKLVSKVPIRDALLVKSELNAIPVSVVPSP